VRRSDGGSCEKTLVVLLLSHKQKLRAFLDPFQVPLRGIEPRLEPGMGSFHARRGSIPKGKALAGVRDPELALERDPCVLEISNEPFVPLGVSRNHVSPSRETCFDGGSLPGLGPIAVESFPGGVCLEELLAIGDDALVDMPYA
jgi:hypothetical protein